MSMMIGETRDLSKERYVYIWADGIYFNIRNEDAKQCILITIGVTSRGNKEFLVIEDGYRDIRTKLDRGSAQSQGSWI